MVLAIIVNLVLVAILGLVVAFSGQLEKPYAWPIVKMITLVPTVVILVLKCDIRTAICFAVGYLGWTLVDVVMIVRRSKKVKHLKNGHP